MHPESSNVRSVICPTCGCSLVRLGIPRESATHYEHEGRELHFCCQSCLDRFLGDPDLYLDRSRDGVVCPTCLGEKPVDVTVRVERDGTTLRFCGCPHCEEAFDRDPEGLTRRLVNW
jgi:YHS domain-containing protein